MIAKKTRAEARDVSRKTSCVLLNSSIAALFPGPPGQISSAALSGNDRRGEHETDKRERQKHLQHVVETPNLSREAV
jgi:hypothetical protein